MRGGAGVGAWPRGEGQRLRAGSRDRGRDRGGGQCLGRGFRGGGVVRERGRDREGRG